MNSNSSQNSSHYVNINVNKLRSEVQAREDRKYKTFEKVLEMCYQKILSTNKTNDDCCCTFICPQVVFGLPLYNLMDCIKFIMEKLVEKGFNIHLALPNQIFISWKKESSDYPESSGNYYQIESSKPQLQLGYKSNASRNNNTNHTNHNNQSKKNNDKHNEFSERKLFMNKPEQNKKDKQYRPIEDYQQTSNSIYDANDIDLFRNKIDELLG
jgi:hypothetical protein